MRDLRLRVASWVERSVAHGPGERFVLWVQGCSLGCPGCFSPSTHSFRDGVLCSVGELEHRILNVAGIEGITVTGGEPMQQAASLAELARRLKRARLSVMCYSGYTLAQLRSSGWPAARELLATTDILVDGPFVREKAANLRWRGSRNQSIHFLTPRYAHLKGTEDRTTHVELRVTKHGFTTTGVWGDGLVEQIEQILQNTKESA